MDPKQPAQLDPKLQEAYDRVMGLALEQPHSSTQPTATPQQSTPITPVQPAASPNVEPTPSAQPITTVSQQTPEMPTTQTTAPLPPQNPSQLPQMSASALDAMAPTPATPVHKKMHAFIAKKGADFKVSPVILIIGGVAFLLIYTVIWIKVFNLSVPIINP